MRTILYIAIALIFIGVAYYLLFEIGGKTEPSTVDTGDPTAGYGGAQLLDDTEDEQQPSATTTEPEPEDPSLTVIGSSVEGRDIEAYHFGEGDTELLFVGGIHGGYEWNTVLLSYELIDYLEANEDTIPSNITVTVVPVLNPDGLFKTVGKEGRFSVADVPTGEEATVPGRFNSNEVDLNRNFDCDWQSSAKWRDVTVDGGSAVFSEPESQAMKAYIEERTPEAVVVYYSSAGGVFASNCHSGVLPKTSELTRVYSEASGYRAFEEFNFYEITGDMVNWLAKINIPAISILLTTHNDTEWTKNKAGFEALLELYSE